MNDANGMPMDEQVAALLAQCDDALAAGANPALRFGSAVPADVRERLERGLRTVAALRRAYPGAPAPPPAAPEDAAGAGPEPPMSRLGRFLIRRELGRGAHGLVFLAHDPQLCREVALKVPYGEALLRPEERARFVREARAAAALDHPNLVPIFEAGELGPVCYSASAYCPGGTLADWLRARGGPVPPPTAARVVAALARAVQYAHDRGVLHRDLKPSNILLHAPPGGSADASADADFPFVPRVTDFGTAKLEAAPDAAGTLHGTVLGTPSYMAPEQARGQTQAIGPAADVYALGAILYELLTSRPPFQAETVLGLLEMVKSQAPAPPSWLEADVPPVLDVICLACLRKDPARRYATAGALAEALECFTAGMPVPDPPAEPGGTSAAPAAGGGAAQRAGRPGRATRGGLVLGLGAALALLAAGGLYGPSALHSVLGRGVLRVETDRAVQVYLKQGGRCVRVLDADEGQSFDVAGGDYEAEMVTVPGGAKVAAGAFRLAPGETHTLAVPPAPPPPALPLTLRGAGPLVHAVAFSPTDPRRLAVAGKGRARLYDLAAGTDAVTLDGGRDEFLALAFRPDGRRLAASNQSRSTVVVWDTTTGEAVLEKFLNCETPGLAYSPDGRRLAALRLGWVGQVWGFFSTWDAGSGGKELAFNERTLRLYLAVAYQPDGRQVATGTGLWDTAAGRPTAGDVRVWDTAGKLQRVLPGHQAEVHGLAYNRDGTRLVSGSDDGTARVWDTADGREVVVFRGHVGPVRSTAFSPDGRRVASAGQDEVVRLWEANTGRELHQFTEHQNPVRSVAFNADGTLLASGDAGGAVVVREVPPAAR